MKKHKFTPAEVIDALKKRSGLVYLAAMDLGCHPNTILNYINRHKSVADAQKARRGELVDAAEHGLLGGLSRGEPWAILFALKTLGADRGYVEPQKHEHRHGGLDGGAVQIIAIEAVEPVVEQNPAETAIEVLLP